MIKIAVIGPIGTGKSSFIDTFSKYYLSIQTENNIIRFGEPTVENEELAKLLRKFYDAPELWTYPLEISISAAFEVLFASIKELEKDPENQDTILLVDTPYSHFIFSSIFEKGGRLTSDEKRVILSINKIFDFDYVIILNESADTIVSRIQKRRGDAEVSPFHKKYTEEHIQNYELFLPEYLSVYFPKAKQIVLENMHELGTEEYENEVKEVVNIFLKE